MTDKTLYVASAGQTHIPFQENEGVPFVTFERPAKPEPPLAPLKLTQEAIDKAVWDTLPSISTSAMVTVEVIRFCMTIGNTRTQSSR